MAPHAYGSHRLNPVVLTRASLAEADLPPYPGIGLADITLVNSERLAQAAFDVLMASDTVGFDTESKPTFQKGETSTGPHLIQLATDHKAYLFQVARLGNCSALKIILESPHVLKVGLGLGNDCSALKFRLDVTLAHVLDLGEMLRGPDHRGTVGAKTAVAHFFGQKLMKSKKTGTSNWANPHLTERQCLYAANDAHVALRLYRAFYLF